MTATSPDGLRSGRLVSGRFCRLSDSCRNRKKVRMAFRARSASPQGRRFRNSIPVSGVPRRARKKFKTTRSYSVMHRVDEI